MSRGGQQPPNPPPLPTAVSAPPAAPPAGSGRRKGSDPGPTGQIEPPDDTPTFGPFHKLEVQAVIDGNGDHRLWLHAMEANGPTITLVLDSDQAEAVVQALNGSEANRG